MTKNAEFKFHPKVTPEKDIKICHSADIYYLMEEEAKADQECFWLISLNQKNKMINKEIVAVGHIDHCGIDPRIVFKRAILNGATSIILVHNHPSGDPNPSNHDHRVTKLIKDAANILCIEFADHIIIGDGYFSFLEKGIL